MPKCLVAFCKNQKGIGKGVHFYALTKGRYDPWMRAIGRNPVTDKVTNNNVICSEHFSRDSFLYIDNRKVLKKSAIPTLKLRPEKNTHSKRTSKNY